MENVLYSQYAYVSSSIVILECIRIYVLAYIGFVVFVAIAAALITTESLRSAIRHSRCEPFAPICVMEGRSFTHQDVIEVDGHQFMVFPSPLSSHH
jgi:hypothetical protein